MSLFKRLFGKEEKKIETPQPNTVTDAPEHRASLSEKEADIAPEKTHLSSGGTIAGAPETDLFKKELYDSLQRYYSIPELRYQLDLTDENGTVYAEHEAFDFTFGEWRKIQSVWDRRALFFAQWDETEFTKLEKWQVLERYVKDRQAVKAWEFQKAGLTQDDLLDIRVILALSKMFRALDVIPKAKLFAKGAYESRPDLDVVKVEYANVLQLSDSEEDKQLSYKLINEAIQTKISNSAEKEIALLHYFLFAPQYLDSSVFAATFLAAAESDADTWDALAGDYYWCPFFRFEHAAFLSKKGEGLRSLAKLDSLADEFPWFKSGVLAYADAINQLRAQRNDPNFMATEMAKLDAYKAMWNEM